LRQAAAGWPCRQWTLSSLQQALCGLDVPVAAMASGELQVGGRGLSMQNLPAQPYFSQLATGRSGYLMARFDELPASLVAEVPLPDVCRDAAFRASKLWCAPAGTVTPLHFDLAHNLHAQLDGKKRVLLYPPRPRRPLYPSPPWSGTPNFSRVDPRQPDLARYPRFVEARAEEAELEPGDVLYIPSGHWHHVTSERTSISVNFWWARGWLAQVVRAADWWKRLRGLSR